MLLWRIRRVFQDYSREYEIVVYDDGSNDGTQATLEPYADVIGSRVSAVKSGGLRIRARQAHP